MAEDTAKQHLTILEKIDSRIENIRTCVGLVMPFQIQRGDIEQTKVNAGLLEKMKIDLEASLRNVEYLTEENKIEGEGK